MPSVIQSDFTAGEWAPEYSGRTDLDKYRAALAKCQSMVVLPGGGLTRRPGTRRVAEAKSGQAQPVRLVRFAPRTTRVYTLEVGPSYIRFFRRRLPVLSAGIPFEVATSYTAGQLEALYF